MLSLDTHLTFFNFAEDKSEYAIYIPCEIIENLEKDLNAVSDFNEIVYDPYIVFSLEDISEIFVYQIYKDVKCCFKNLAVAIHNVGLDFIITIQDDTNIIFPILEIKKKKTFSLKNIFKNKNKKLEANKNITINYSSSLDFFVDTERFENCLFSIILEEKISQELVSFFDTYCKIWDTFPFKKYPNLFIYFNKKDVEDGILFNITNCFVDRFILNCIQERLFFIVDLNDKPALFLNDTYFTTSQNKKLFFVNISDKNASFVETENYIKFNKLMLKREILNLLDNKE